MSALKLVLAVAILPMAVLAFTGCGGGGGGGGGGGPSPTPTPPPATGTPPSFGGSDSETGTTPTVTISPGGSDDDGDLLDYTYTYQGGPLNVPIGTTWTALTAPDASGSTDVTFPVNGVYIIRVTADDGNGNTPTFDITIDLNATPFEITGEVEDTISGSTSGAANLDCELSWKLMGDITVLISTTPASGEFEFAELLGSPDDFAVMVPGSL